MFRTLMIPFLLAVGASSTPAALGQAAAAFIEDEKVFIGVLLHGPAAIGAPPAPQSEELEDIWPNAVFWPNTTDIKILRQAPPLPEVLTIDPSGVSHMMGPHGETEGGHTGFPTVIAARPGVGQLPRFDPWPPAAHGHHFDHHVTMASYAWQNNRFRAFIVLHVALHPDPPPDPYRQMHTSATPTTSATLPAEVVAGAGLVANESNGQTEVVVAAYGLTVADLLSVDVRLGSPATPGAVVWSAPLASFDEHAGVGIIGKFSPQLAPADVTLVVQSGGFLEIATSQGSLIGELELAPTPLGTNYCGPAEPNSLGVGARISAEGSLLVGANSLVLTATNLPSNQFGYFLNSATQAFIAAPGGSQGNLCVGGLIGRHIAGLGNSGTGLAISLDVDLTSLPTPLGPTQVLSGETWNFQLWYRDVNPGQTSNFTDAVSITFE